MKGIILFIGTKRIVDMRQVSIVSDTQHWHQKLQLHHFHVVCSVGTFMKGGLCSASYSSSES